MKKAIHLVIMFFCSSNFFYSQILKVPEQFISIQAAIDTSSDGDTILVAEGIYHENINFKGKKITLASHFITDGNKSHIKNTVINGSKSQHAQYGSVVYFVTGEDTNSVLYGFTITGGTGTHSPPKHKYEAMAGGGIVISKSGAKIMYNRIINNSVFGPRASGGAFIIDSPKQALLIMNNVIENNKVFVTESHGGGAGIFCLNCNDKVLIRNNIFDSNIAIDTDSSKAIGGAIKLIGSNPLIKNNLIKRNQASFGGAIGTSYPINCKEAIIENNTIVNNKAEIMGGAIFSFSQKLLITNCIIWENTSPTDPQIVADRVVEYSDIQGGHIGEGNIDQDPIFTDILFFNLSIQSPCVDAGNPDSIYTDFHDTQNSDLALFPSQGKIKNDMGTYGGSYSKSFWEFSNDR